MALPVCQDRAIFRDNIFDGEQGTEQRCCVKMIEFGLGDEAAQFDEAAGTFLAADILKGGLLTRQFGGCLLCPPFFQVEQFGALLKAPLLGGNRGQYLDAGNDVIGRGGGHGSLP